MVEETRKMEHWELADCINAGLALARAATWTEYFRSAAHIAETAGPFPIEPLNRALNTISENVQEARDGVKRMGPVMQVRFEGIERKIQDLRAALPKDKAQMTPQEAGAMIGASQQLRVQIAEAAPFIVADCACDVCRE